jgi:ectoine hydroxylase-related dioxygenase (phytanoyl-CoA dioxygenase family)
MDSYAPGARSTSQHLDVEKAISKLDDQGYCIIPSLIDASQADEVRSILAGLLEAEFKDSHQTEKYQRVGRIAVKHPVFLELMCHPVIVDIWTKWLGPDVICSTWSGNTLYPGHGKINWHADYPYWSLQTPWPRGKLAAQTIWMLDDFTEENGGTGVAPQSHRRCCPPDDAEGWPDDGQIITGTRGSVVLLDGLLWHTARPNQSGQPRSALLGMYTRPCCLAMEKMRDQLAQIDNPSEIAKQLMGANQYQPNDIGG